MATKKFPNPALDLIQTNERQLEATEQQKNNIIEKKVVEVIEEKVKAKPKEEVVLEKILKQQVAYTLQTSIRMGRILDKMKEADPENAGKYSKKFFVEDAILKSIINYEKKYQI